jgi:hypothetical protein
MGVEATGRYGFNRGVRVWRIDEHAALSGTGGEKIGAHAALHVMDDSWPVGICGR